MKKTLKGRLSYANVISTLCLFLLVAGGTAVAASTLGKNSVGPKQLKKNAVTTAKIKNGAVTGAKINLSSLGAVPTASNALTLEGKTASSFAPSTAEPVHIVGASGQPAFQGNWGVGGAEQVPGFWKDPFGTVYLQGQAGRNPTGSGTTTIFTLPPGFRPTENSYFSTYPSSGTGTAAIAVLKTGAVVLFNLQEPTDDNFVGLGGIVFRAGS